MNEEEKKNVVNLRSLTTESINPETVDLDRMSVLEILEVMNREDEKIPGAIKLQFEKIDECVKLSVEALKNKGRIIYVGAGTSGRIGLMDAVECPPTFGTDPEQVLGLMAGGERAFVKAQEGAEDRRNLGRTDLENKGISENDIVIGIAASGRTPYVIGALEYARLKGAHTAAISCNKNSEISDFADVAIEIDVGPEVLTGSTRLKAGTAQKMVLNMISTATMVQMGKVYKNYMVDVLTTNEKLKIRAENMVIEITGVDRDTAKNVLTLCDYNVKTAIVMLLTGCKKEEAKIRLQEADGYVHKAI